jgi:hypothetical protein
MRPEQAIEIRNRKRVRLCLFVPAGGAEAAASSLQNAFAEWDLDGALASIAHEMLQDVPSDLRRDLLVVA